jgi:sRNA-binding regulator protein Hfq
MQIEPNQEVKILFRNGTSVEGVVLVWDKEYILKSRDGKSILIIQNPEQDIMAIKVILNTAEPKTKNNYEYGVKKNVKPTIETSKVVTEDDDPDSLQRFAMDLRAAKLAELRIAAAEEERKAISEKLKSHNIGEVKQTNYGYPSILNKIKG